MSFSLFDFASHILSGLGASQSKSAVALTVVEVQELENIFALLLMGFFVGLPSPPTFLAVELLPFMKEEMEILDKRAGDAGDMLAEMCGTLGID
jgi:hypothetical protein